MKILHTGDLHLGRFYKGELPQKISTIRREELWKNFMNTIEYIKENRIDVLLICGDIFEREFFTYSDMVRFSELINSLNETYTFIIGGNHDYVDENSLLFKVNFNEKVYIFKDKPYYDIDELNLRVHGISWDTQFDFNRELEFTVDKNKVNLLMLHGTVGGKTHFPIDINNLINKYDFDYIALGHIHLPQKIKENCYYCGSPEGLGFGELGDRGFIFVDIDEKKRRVEFVKNSIRNYNELVLDIDANMTMVNILEVFSELLQGKEDDMNKIIVAGEHNNPGYIIEMIKSQRDYFYVEVVDKLKFNISIEELYKSNIDNVIGKYIVETREDEALLAIGLRALLEAKNEN